ncbi:MAG: OmpA family protein [Bacteroidia bacterium]|jgi:outer membrane protein OmpA-like peptidoglycan-associated protein|nr:OmpA family protein [Bacteroidia bacterium]
MKLKMLFVFVLLLLNVGVYAQNHLDNGNVYYDFFNYREAIKEYELALKNERTFKNEGYLLEHLALSYLYTFQYEKAEKYFEELIKLGDKKATPTAYLDYGNVLKIMGKYEQAREQFSYYSKIEKKDAYTAFLNRSLSWAEKNKDSVNNKIVITPTAIDVSGQSLGYCLYDNGLFFSQATDSIIDTYSNLFDLRFGTLVNKLQVKVSQNYVDEISFPFNEGSPCVTKDGQTLYFSATALKIKKDASRKVGNVEIIDDGVGTLKIYVAKLVDGKFTDVLELPFNKQFNCMHPAISDDGNTLIFSSDMLGGYGGLDLWKTTRKSDGNWTTPINLGEKINTSENETYPILFNGMLYFSSKGHVGFGGYDLFKIQLDVNLLAIGVATNLGKPLNSSKDDMALLLLSDGKTGYFSSNRDNAKGFDKVYYFDDGTVSNQLIALKEKEAEDKLKQANAPSTPAPPVSTATTQVVAPVSTTPTEVKVAATNNIKKSVTTPKPTSQPKITIPMLTVLFNFASAELNTEGMKTLDEWIISWKNNKTKKITLTGYADCRGATTFNQKLSAKRVAAIKQYLVANGVPVSSIVSIIAGEIEAQKICKVCDQCSDEQHASFRKVELKAN